MGRNLLWGGGVFRFSVFDLVLLNISSLFVLSRGRVVVGFFVF